MFLGPKAIGDQASDHVGNKVHRVAVMGMLDLKNVLEPIDHSFINCL
jgi:hypothetical protein